MHRLIFLLIALVIPAVRAAGADKPITVSAERKSIDRALGFLQADALRWRDEKQCSSCHHGAMTVWALSEAKQQGYPVSAKSLADMTTWTKERLATIDKPRDTRLGWNMVNTPAIYLSLMAAAVPTQSAISVDELNRIGGHLMVHQEKDGSWAWSLAPAQNRPPPVFESDEVVTLMANLALARAERNGSSTKTAELKAARKHSIEWLSKQSPGASTQSVAIRLFRDVATSKPQDVIKVDIEHLLRLQHADGGWGQESEIPSDAYATGQALYFLTIAGVARDREEVRRGVAFLVKTQNSDGSWPMKSRAHPGAKPFTNPVPITYFGSGWATLGLLRSVPKP